MANQENSSLTTYQTFVLRIWQEEPTKERRVLLLNTNTGERWLFADFQALSVHFQQNFENGN